MKKLQIILAITTLAVSSSLFANGMMNATFPEDGAMMMNPIDRVEVNFAEPMKLVNLKVIDSTGKPVSIDFERSKQARTNFKATIPNLKPGNYKVHWKAVGDDGHMMKGTFGFMQH
ncbi:copper resistance CopC family protein [Pseudoalteromonas sp.]|jgi:methionine-rich copper-binding protein CopC|uniref:copper resistance CopC family protein n=1 Tax=Pseudoalteromonas sp. TaxID=53249 RepID=UPI00262DE321|nr:copper resistance CopC family protein [Pseudoalteromonas sp.]MCP4586917.1 copper resistance protein CopC [Pseudoalteromonas sp.]